MQLSLSVRIAEGFLSKEIPIMAIDDVVSIAKSCGYQAICMRASQCGIHSPQSSVEYIMDLITKNHLPVSMVTGDFDTVYNNENAPNSLRNIEPYLRLAEQFDCRLVRVAVKSTQDIEWAQRACELASRRNICLVHQCHTLSLFETVDSIEHTLRLIDRPNFGLIYEPANLQICGQDYGYATLARLRPWIRNVYLQNHRLHPKGAISLDTHCRGSVAFDIRPIHEPGTVNFHEVLGALKRLDYNQFVTVHQSAQDGESPLESAERTAIYLRKLWEQLP